MAVDEEVFLLGTARGDDAFSGGAEQLQDTGRLLAERFHRAQQRRLLVERFAGPADERRRNDERDRAAAIQQPRRAGRIPCGVAARFEGGAHAAGGKARRVGLALDQFLAGEFHDSLAVAVAARVQEGIVLFRGDTGQRLEPVRVVRGAVLDGPVLHGGRDRVGDGQIQRVAVRDRPTQLLIDRRRQALLLDVIVEDQTAKRFRRVRPARLLRLCQGPVANRADRLPENSGTHHSPPSET